MEIFHLNTTHSDKHINEFSPKFALNIAGKSSWTKENVRNWTKQGIWCLLKKWSNCTWFNNISLNQRYPGLHPQGCYQRVEYSLSRWGHICSFGFFSTKQTWTYWRKSIKGPPNWWSGCSTDIYSAGISTSLAWRRESLMTSHQWIKYPTGG